MDPAPRLACQQCKQRKLRCDKGSPCNACRNAGLVCQVVQRARLPRGKSGKKQTQKQSLESRLKQLETYINQHAQMNLMEAAEHSKLQPTQRQFLAPDFWSSLSKSISGVREILEDSGDEKEEVAEYHAEKQAYPGKTASSDAHLLFPNMSSQGLELPDASPATSETLFGLFKDRVDTVYKVVHLSKVLALIRAAYSDGTLTANILALEYAMYFMAICTINEDEAEAMGLGSRIDLIQFYRARAERYLASANLLSHPDLRTLQALVIYMIGLRTCLNSATTWTLVAVAARIAAALRLGDEDPSKFTILELDARRRVLYAIGVLDTHAALDRGTIPVLPASAFRTPPLDVDDSDNSPARGALTPSRPPITDMTHSTMTYQAMLCQRKMYDLSTKGLDTWSERKQLVVDFGAHIDQLARQIGESRIPMHVLIVTSGRKIHRSLELLLRRPPYRQSIESVPIWDGFDVMLAATEVLELHLEVPSLELKPWAWKNWVQWHALAVLLAELSVRLSDPLADRAFEVASNAYRYYARIVADSQSGLLWKPIARLMRRVQRAREEASVASQDSNTSQLSLETLLDHMPAKLPSPDDLHSFSHPAQNIHHQSEEHLERGVDILSFESDQQSYLIWDEFLEDIIDTSAWQ
ncbi:hypothetical protein C7974DRAFT_202685 [Boeremia exigua]|uniref:uncharacterized protein n=1 Tax=Boeremia exigua TaxID=749465 RepID=UPI001E8E4680|nr:uncharacterized protein C7974DRAFT_202685 [Boeremia exigua]KAH6625535.1 hypothetical protein C7974DRAFT_202685 [Boeremia exigua]